MAATPAPSAAVVHTSQARLGGRGFGGFLKVLGIAYLAHLLFGLGGGGSPFGLFLLVAIVLWLVSRRRRRLAYYR